MTTFLQAVIGGAGQGALDAMLALGIVLIYRTTGVLNFAQASTGTLAGYVIYSVSQGRSLWLAVSVGLAVAAALGAGAHAAVSSIRSKQYALTAAVATLALSVLLQYLVRKGWGVSGIYPSPFGLGAWTIGDVSIAYYYAGSLATAAALAVGIGAFLRWTTTGTMLRALADDPDAAQLCGGNVGAMIYGIWAVAGILAGVSAFFAFQITFQSSFVDTLFVGALIAAVLGGLRSLTGAFAGAIGLEVARDLFQTYASGSLVGYTQTFLLLLLIGVLLFAPRRLLAQSAGRVV
jgi:branched-chain amino acid transport system permease protein